MKYFHNENPQVTLWKEKAFKVKQLFDEYRAVAENYNGKIFESLNDLTEEIKRFNSLPWYKKMFYKFKR